MNEVILGAIYKDRVTGLVGMAVASTRYLWACNRVSLQPQEVKDGKPAEWTAFDIHALEYVGPGISESLNAEPQAGQDAPKTPERTGGPGDVAALPSTPRRDREPERR